ncbi:hypothetical protein QMZ05_05750 [Bradyrhizobium sp. INPA03-11B]|uniref:hypothetical protein n=1 Tax=Bradyrhizobium sp. INPA03-11B TaxID=418598 RepID=UPI00338DD1D6
MTVDVTEIETILGPLRGFDSDTTRMISLDSIGGPWGRHPDRARAEAALRWASSMGPPIARWLDIEPDLEIPRQMRVAAFVAFMTHVPVLADGYPWCLIDHQAAGHACKHLRFVGHRILLKPGIEAKFTEIAKGYYDSQLGWDIPSLSELVRYRSQLQEIGLDCDGYGTFRYLMEGLYPIDLSQSVIDQICLNPFPLEHLLGSPRPYGSIEHYAILVFIAANSD